MYNYYFDPENALHPYTHSALASDGSVPPSNALRVEPTITSGHWPCEKNGKWVDVEDHRTLDGAHAQAGTPYWLPTKGDVHGSPARLMQDVGPLPDGSVINEPAPTTAQALSALRDAREVLFSAYDKHIAELSRASRLASTDEERAAIAATIALWDAYAVALCDLPEQDGAPWADGDIPWPTAPEA